MRNYLNQKLTLIHLIAIAILTAGVFLTIEGNKAKDKVTAYDNGNVTIAVIDLNNSNKEEETNYKLIAGVALIVLGIGFFAKTYFNNQPKPEEDITLKLTDKEKEIAALIVQGKTNKEIANDLCISLSTVKTHINNLYKKSSVSSRTELTDLMQNTQV